MNNFIIPDISDGYSSDKTLSLHLPLEYQPQLKVIAITGSLGSGKTTMLNSILSNYSSCLNSWMIIENDVGESNIDAVQLNAPAESIRALTSGCVCCEDLSSLKRELENIKATHRRIGVDVVAIETTGIANPAEIKKALTDLKLGHRVVVTVNVRDFAHDSKLGLLEGHIESADIIILTHWDHFFDLDQMPDDASSIIFHDEVSKVLSEIDRRNRHAPMACMNRQGKILGDLDPLSIELNPEVPNKFLFNPTPCCDGQSENHQSHSHKASSPSIYSANAKTTSPHPMVYARTIRPKAELTADSLVNILSSSGASVLRVKGFINGEFVHGVRNSFEITAATTVQPSVLNIISLKPLPDEILSQLESNEEYSPEVLPEGLDLEEAQVELKKLLRHFPQYPVSRNGRLLVDYVGDKGYKYAEAEGIPSDLRMEYYRLFAQTRLDALKIYTANDLKSEPGGSYWGLRLGSAITWLLVFRTEEMVELGLYDELASFNPATLYFSSMSNANSEAEFPTFTPDWFDLLSGYADLMRHEIGSEKAGLLLRLMFERVTGANGAPSWQAEREKLSEILFGQKHPD
jgi:G3E family GTPase